MQVLLTKNAEDDLIEIHSYVEDNASAAIAERLLNRVEELFTRLSEMLSLGPLVPELADLGIIDYRQLADDLYRVIYQVADETVIVFLIAHTRRDFQYLLMRRLLDG